MKTDTQKRQQIVNKIYRIPPEKLNELDEFVSQLEKETDNKDLTLSFAGAWQDMDESVFQELTDNLIDNRQRNKRRNNEQGAY